MMAENVRYNEDIVIYLSDKDKAYGNEIHATAGMRRKGIAIANDKKNYYLINENNVALFKIEKHGKECYGSHDYLIRRSLTGYYIITEEGRWRIYRWGRDDDYEYEERICDFVYDENGHRINREEWPSNAKEVYAFGKYPIEMGNGLIRFENVFYDIELLEIKFCISKNFAIKSVFHNDFCQLDYVADNKDYLIKVQNGKIINSFEIDNLEKLTDIILETNDVTICSLLKNSNKYKEFSSNIEKIMLGRLGKYSQFVRKYPHSYSAISSRNVESGQFEHGKNLINEEELLAINELHDLISSKSSNKIITDFDNAFHFAKRSNYDNIDYICQLFSEFFLLIEYRSYVDYMSYRFYNYQGQELSKNIYTMKKNYYNFYSRVFRFCKLNGEEKNGIIVVNNGQFEEHLFSHYPFIQQYPSDNWQNKITVYDSFIKFENHYYNFKGEELSINYIDVCLIDIVKGIIKSISPHFLVHEKPFGHLEFVPIFSNGTILLPNIDSYKLCIDNLKEFNTKRPGNIDDIILIGNYTSNEGAFSLYKVEYRPKAICNTKGIIILDNNPAILNTIGLFNSTI